MQTSPGHPYTISFVNGKGGVGKTTATVSTAYKCAAAGNKTLIIDLDPQANATALFKPRGRPSAAIAADILTQSAGPDIFRTRLPNLFIVPSGPETGKMAGRAGDSIDSFTSVRQWLGGQGGLDYVFIDCPPSLGFITQNAMIASDGIVVPMIVSKFSLDGLGRIFDLVAQLKNVYGAGPEVLGALLCFFNARSTLSKALLPELSKMVPVFDARIAPSVVVEEAHILGETVCEYNPRSGPAKAFSAFWKELSSRRAAGVEQRVGS